MKVADVMTRGIDLVEASATVQAAATQMAELDVGAVLVGGEAVLGILTDRDILVRVVVEGLNPAYVPVSRVMTREVVGCRADDPVEAALAEMRDRQFRRMPVFDGDGKPVGVVTLSDLAKSVAGPEGTAEALRELVEPHRSRTLPENDDAEAKSRATRA